MDNKQLCESLIKADKQEEVEKLLKKAGYWDDRDLWRDLGDIPNNHGTVGGQQSTAMGALIEKITNSIDARLVNACLEQRIDPTSKDAPDSISEAVEKFITKYPTENTSSLARWDNKDITNQKPRITITWTGPAYTGRDKAKFKSELEKKPSITIADEGEGQTPDDFPNTFCSLHKSNKTSIRFVHGRFNMGSTGTLRFCGKEDGDQLQLIVSRRNQSILTSPSSRDREWGFTVVRRFKARKGERYSVYRYLAPKGEVLSFAEESLKILPEGDNAYARSAEHGALIKLYQYNVLNTGLTEARKENKIYNDLNNLLPLPALPFEFHECRPYTGNITRVWDIKGLSNSLEEQNNPDDLFERKFHPHPGRLSIRNKYSFPFEIYCFKDNKKKSNLSRSRTIIYTINGQTHSVQNSSFLTRSSIRGLSEIKNNLLVIVNLSSIESSDFETLFMTNREKMSESELKKDIEKALEKYIAEDEDLKRIDREMRQRKIGNATSEASLTKIIEAHLPKDIWNWFISGDIKTHEGVIKHGPTPPDDPTPPAKLNLHQFPTYFRFEKKSDYRDIENGGQISIFGREVSPGSDLHIRFDTDANDEYFSPDRGVGRYKILDGHGINMTKSWEQSGPSDGVARFTLRDTNDFKPGDRLEFQFRIEDDNISGPPYFLNKLSVNVIAKAKPPGGPTKSRKTPGGFPTAAPPRVDWIEKEKWEDHNFDETSGGTIMEDTDYEYTVGGFPYCILINKGNKYLEHALLKISKQRGETERITNYYKYSMYFAIIAFVRGQEGNNQEGNNTSDTEEFVRKASKAVAPAIMLMMDLSSKIEAKLNNSNSEEDSD